MIKNYIRRILVIWNLFFGESLSHSGGLWDPKWNTLTLTPQHLVFPTLEDIFLDVLHFININVHFMNSICPYCHKLVFFKNIKYFAEIPNSELSRKKLYLPSYLWVSCHMFKFQEPELKSIFVNITAIFFQLKNPTW